MLGWTILTNLDMTCVIQATFITTFWRTVETLCLPSGEYNLGWVIFDISCEALIAGRFQFSCAAIASTQAIYTLYSIP